MTHDLSTPAPRAGAPLGDDAAPRRLIGMDRDDMAALVAELGEKPFRAGRPAPSAVAIR